MGPQPVALEMTTSLQNHAAGRDEMSGGERNQPSVPARVTTEQEDGKAGSLHG